MYRLQYGNSIITYDIIKSSRRKTSQITIDKTGVLVRIPDSKTITDAKKMVTQKAQWIFKKQLYYSKQIPQIPKITFKKDSTIPYKGKNYPFEVISGRIRKVKLVKNIIQFYITQKRHSISQLKEMYQEWLAVQAGTHINKIISKYSSTIGKPLKITIKSLKGRWGSTTNAGEIILNANLMKAPVPVIQYVIIHELCHLKIKEHNQSFWSLVSKNMPKYQSNVKWLEVNGISIT
jgi:predicted metal-dependent hydrolase